MLAIIHDQLLRSYSVAVGLAIPGLASPVLFLIGGWMSKIERWVEAGDEGVGCRGRDPPEPVISETNLCLSLFII